MSRVQLALNVDDVESAVAFYTKLFGTGPAKLRPGYANFAVADPPLKLVLIENPTAGPATLNHLGVEVGSTGEVSAARDRLAAAGVPTTEEGEVECCFALQDKVWAEGPGGARWEIYTVLADAETGGPEPPGADPASQPCRAEVPDLAAEPACCPDC